MRVIIMFLLTMSCVSCATMTPLEKKRKDVVDCIKQLKEDDSATMDAFEACRQIYGVSKVTDGVR